jgi:hypothetical protein
VHFFIHRNKVAPAGQVFELLKRWNGHNLSSYFLFTAEIVLFTAEIAENAEVNFK